MCSQDKIKGYYNFVLPLVKAAGDSQTFKPSTVWSKYSMLKAVLSVKEDVHIDKFPKLIAFLKKNSVGYAPKKSKVLSREEIDQFLVTASDETSLLTKYFMQSRSEIIAVSNKTVHELVTKYDTNIEQCLVKQIKEKYPDHKFIGEEGSGQTEEVPTLTDDPTWIIDPVDGTTNFSRKIPLCGISVGLTAKKDQVLAIIFIPYLNEMYTAIKGEGAYLNGERIRCSNVTDPEKSLFGYEVSIAGINDYFHKMIMTRLSHYVKKVIAVRTLGCPILSQCYVASGKLDAYQGDGLHPWDVAAGTLIVKEAGGYVVESSGKEFDLMKPNVLVTATKELCDKYLEIAKCADAEREVVKE